MKKFISYIILFSLVIRPITNISLVSYYSLNITEIIDKYCINKDKPALNCNGKCYLSKKLNAVDDTSGNNDKISFTESFVLVFLIKTADFNFDIINKQIENRTINGYADSYKAISVEINTPPPKHV